MFTKTSSVGDRILKLTITNEKSVREAELSLFVFMENLQFNIVFQKRKSIQNLCDCDQDLCICEIFD